MIYGYARVSTIGQSRDGNSLEDQIAALTAYGCQEIIQEAFTGKTMERPQFTELMNRLKEGDTLVVCKLDRFARTAIEGVQTVRTLFERGIKVHILNMGLIENTLTGNLILTVMLAFAEYERGVIVERTQTGSTAQRYDPGTVFKNCSVCPFHESEAGGNDTCLLPWRHDERSTARRRTEHTLGTGISASLLE